MLEILCKTEKDMQRLGQSLGACMRVGDVVLLTGEMGAGKSVLTRAAAHAMGVEGPVPSPTFTILNIHEGRAMRLYHFDLYRLSDADELYAHPLHPYTRDMLAAMPENGLHFRPGYAPAHDDTRVTGCKYRMRCPNCSEKCAEMPPMADVDGHKVRCWQYV